MIEVFDPNDVCCCGDLRCEHVGMSGASFFTETCRGFRLASVPSELTTTSDPSDQDDDETYMWLEAEYGPGD